MSKRYADELLRSVELGSEPRDPLFVGSVEKAFRVLGAFRDRREPMSLSEIAEAAGLPKSAAQRFTHTLTLLGYLTKDERTRRFRPSVKALDLAYAFLRSETLVERATPFAIQASERCGERVNMSLRDGDDLVYGIRIPRRIIDVESTMIGRRHPLAATAGGRAILATLPPEEAAEIVRRSPERKLTQRSLLHPDEIIRRVEEARKVGYAFNDSEVLHGEIAVGAAVLDRDGVGIAAIHISVSSVGWSVARVEETLAPLAIETANAISRDRLRY